MLKLISVILTGIRCILWSFPARWFADPCVIDGFDHCLSGRRPEQDIPCISFPILCECYTKVRIFCSLQTAGGIIVNCPYSSRSTQWESENNKTNLFIKVICRTLLMFSGFEFVMIYWLFALQNSWVRRVTSTQKTVITWWHYMFCYQESECWIRSTSSSSIDNVT